MEVLDQLLAVAIIAAFFFLIYTSLRKQSITETVEDIRNAFGGKKDDGNNRPERYYK
jgi:hypothetical protein